MKNLEYSSVTLNFTCIKLQGLRPGGSLAWMHCGTDGSAFRRDTCDRTHGAQSVLSSLDRTALELYWRHNLMEVSLIGLWVYSTILMASCIVAHIIT